VKHVEVRGFVHDTGGAAFPATPFEALVAIATIIHIASRGDTMTPSTQP